MQHSFVFTLLPHVSPKHWTCHQRACANITEVAMGEGMEVERSGEPFTAGDCRGLICYNSLVNTFHTIQVICASNPMTKSNPSFEASSIIFANLFINPHLRQTGVVSHKVQQINHRGLVTPVAKINRRHSML